MSSDAKAFTAGVVSFLLTVTIVALVVVYGDGRSSAIDSAKSRCFECGAMYSASGHEFCQALKDACDDCYPGIKVAAKEKPNG